MSDEPKESAAAIVGRMETEVKWPVTVKLKHPIEFGKECIESLEFRRGRLGDIKGMSVSVVPSAEQCMLIASRLSGKPLKVIESLDVEDSAEVLALVLLFFAGCLGAGAMA